MKLPLMIGGGVLLTLLLMNGCKNNKQNTSKTSNNASAQAQANTSTKEPETETIAAKSESTKSTVEKSKSEPNNLVTQSNQRDTNQNSSTEKSKGEEVPTLADLESTDPQKDNSKPNTVSSEGQIDRGIADATNANDRSDYEGALEDLRALVNQTNFKSAKARYFLARQYQMMDQNGLKSNTNQSYAEASKLHANAAAKLGNTYLEEYPSNKIYAEKSKNLLVQL